MIGLNLKDWPIKSIKAQEDRSNKELCEKRKIDEEKRKHREKWKVYKRNMSWLADIEHV